MQWKSPPSSSLSIEQEMKWFMEERDTKALPVVYIRFNPHSYTVGDTLFNPSLESAFEKLWSVIEDVGKMRDSLLPGLNLIYVNYSQHERETQEGELWSKLKCFTNQKYSKKDGNYGYMLHCRQCVFKIY